MGLIRSGRFEASCDLRGFLGRHRHTHTPARLRFVFGPATPDAFGLSDATMVKSALDELGRLPTDFSSFDPREVRYLAGELNKWLSRPLVDAIGDLA